MRILGIDPGLVTTGYGIIDADRCGIVLKAAGFIKTQVRERLPQRLEHIHAALGRIIDEHGPDALILEKIYAHYKHPATAALLGHARGVICMLAEEKKIAFYEYPATRIKKVITGRGHASKIQIQKMIAQAAGTGQNRLGPVDVTDAIAVALTHAYACRAPF